MHSTDIIVVGGHSTDSTRKIVKASGVRYFLQEEEGIGSAIRLGIKAGAKDLKLKSDGFEIKEEMVIKMLKKTTDF